MRGTQQSVFVVSSLFGRNSNIMHMQSAQERIWLEIVTILELGWGFRETAVLTPGDGGREGKGRGRGGGTY